MFLGSHQIIWKMTELCVKFDLTKMAYFANAQSKVCQKSCLPINHYFYVWFINQLDIFTGLIRCFFQEIGNLASWATCSFYVIQDLGINNMETFFSCQYGTGKFIFNHIQLPCFKVAKVKFISSFTFLNILPQYVEKKFYLGDKICKSYCTNLRYSLTISLWFLWLSAGRYELLMIEVFCHHRFSKQVMILISQFVSL